MISYGFRGSSDCDLPPHTSRDSLVLQLFFLKTSYWQWVVLSTEVILGIMGGRSLVQNHLRSQSLHPMMKDTTKKMKDTTKITGLTAVAPKEPMTRGGTMPAPVTLTRVDAKMLRLAPAPVMDTGMDTTIHPESEDDCKAHVHIYLSPLISGKGKGLRHSNAGEDMGAIDDSRYNRRWECELGESTIYINR